MLRPEAASRSGILYNSMGQGSLILTREKSGNFEK